MKRCSVLLAALLFIAPAVACAQPRLQVLLGHQGLHRLRSWTPLQVQLESGEKTIEGTLEVADASGSVYRGGAHVVLYSRPVSLPSSSRETFDFAVLIDNISSPLKVSLRDRSGEVVTRQVDVRENLITGDFIIALSRTPAFDFLSRQLGPHGRVVHSRPEHLPGRPEGYDGVRTIIFHDADLSLLKGEQMRAIKGWAALGGRLIITGGPGQERYRVLADAALLPGKVHGMGALHRLSGLSERYGQSLSLPAPLPVVSLKDVSGKVLLSEGGTPLIIQREWGRGKILFLAFDPALPVFSRWTGFKALWGDLISGARPPDLFPSHPPESGMGYETLRRTVITFPAGWQVALYAAAYLAAYSITRRIFWGRRLYWPVVSAVVAVFVLSAEVFFYRPYLPGSYLKFQFATVDVFPDAGVGVKRTEVTMFSTRGRMMQAGGGNMNPMVEAATPESYRGQERGYQVVQDGSTGFAIRALLKPWDTRSFSTLEVVETPVKIKVSHEGGRAYIDLYNNTPYVLTGARLIAGRRMLKLKDLRPDSVLRLDVSAGVLGLSSVPFSLEEAVANPQRLLKMSMLERYLPVTGMNEVDETSEVVFLVWLEGGAFSGFNVEGEHRRVSLTLVRARFEI